MTYRYYDYSAIIVGIYRIMVNLRYPDKRQATQARNELIAKARG